jgi:hypothetical protein
VTATQLNNVDASTRLQDNRGLELVRRQIVSGYIVAYEVVICFGVGIHRLVNACRWKDVKTQMLTIECSSERGPRNTRKVVTELTVETLLQGSLDVGIAETIDSGASQGGDGWGTRVIAGTLEGGSEKWEVEHPKSSQTVGLWSESATARR